MVVRDLDKEGGALWTLLEIQDISKPPFRLDKAGSTAILRIETRFSFNCIGHLARKSFSFLILGDISRKQNVHFSDVEVNWIYNLNEASVFSDRPVYTPHILYLFFIPLAPGLLKTTFR